MEKLKRRWRRVPRSIRRPVVMIAGSFFILAAGLTGWLPGPGGIPLFLIGIAILATEFPWAKRLQDWVIDLVAQVGRWLKAHKILGTCIILIGLCVGVTSAYLLYTHF